MSRKKNAETTATETNNAVTTNNVSTTENSNAITTLFCVTRTENGEFDYSLSTELTDMELCVLLSVMQEILEKYQAYQPKSYCKNPPPS